MNINLIKQLNQKFKIKRDAIFSSLRIIPIRIKFIVKYRIKNAVAVFRIGNNSVIEGGVRYLLRSPGSFIMENNARICKYCKIVINGGNLNIGSNVTVGESCVFNVFSDILIADNVLMADKINFITNEHVYKDISIPVNSQKEKSRSIQIGEDGWIGINVTILAGTSIGKHCIIGANSVVKGSFPDFCVIAGNPARIIKKYDFALNDWVSNENLYCQ